MAEGRRKADAFTRPRPSPTATTLLSSGGPQADEGDMLLSNRAAAALADDADETDSEEAGGRSQEGSTSSELLPTSRRSAASTPFLERLRQRLAWGSTTREEKRSLWSRPARRRSQRQSNIGVPTELLLQALKVQLQTAGVEEACDDDVAELSALLRLQLRHEVMESSLWLVDAFDVLSSDYAANESRGPSTPRNSVEHGERDDAVEGYEATSDRFIDGLCVLMQRANFRLFSQREWRFAQSEKFMFTLPVDVAWEGLDSGAISRLFVRHPHLGLQAAQLARRVLVFHRGSGAAQMT